MKIIQNNLPTPCQTCRKLQQGRHKTRGTIAFRCRSGLHFPSKKNTCKREHIKAQEVFKNFLRDNGIYEKYCRNFDVKFNRGTIIKRPHLFIRHAFDFVGADGGYFFWRGIDIKWVSLLENRK